jgi:hypothetical protein
LLGGYIIVPAPGLAALTAGQKLVNALIPKSTFFAMRDKNQLLSLLSSLSHHKKRVGRCVHFNAYEESVFRSMRPIARLLGITLRLDTGLSSIPALSDVFDNQNATLFIKHEKNMISITWANQDDLAFLVQNGHDASRIKRIIGAMEELYFKGIVLQDVRWQEIFSLSRDKWKRIFDKLRSEAPFFIPQKTKEAIKKPHRAVYAVQRFLIGEDLSTLLPRLWIDNATWNKYWMGFLSVGLGGDVDNFPEELVLGWKELWDNLDVNSSLLQELSQTLIPLLKNNIPCFSHPWAEN